MSKKTKTTEPKPQGLVLYVDGGCRPGFDRTSNAKYGGWGFHGYTYDLGVHPPKLRTKKNVQTTLGYQLGETVSLDKQVIPNGYIDGYGSMTDNDRSDTAELTGMLKAVNFIKDTQPKKVHFLLDNQYVLNGMQTGYSKWEACGWKKPDGKPYANKTLWQDVMHTYQPLTQNIQFSFAWVNGHSGDLGNDRADELATRGVYLGRSGQFNVDKITVSPIAKYRQPDADIHPFFSRGRWYFNTLTGIRPMSKKGQHVYHCGSHGPDDTLVGKPMGDSVACVLFVKQPEPVLEKIWTCLRETVPNPLNDLCSARLDTIMVPRIYHDILTEGTGVLSRTPQKLNFDGLVTTEEKEVCRIIRPSGLTFKLIDVHNFMEKELEKYHHEKETLLLTEITDLLYTDEVKKKTVVQKCVLKPGDKFIKVPVSYLKEHPNEKLSITLTAGIDMPPIAQLNQIGQLNTKVYVSTWLLSEAAFRYALIFDTSEESMIWMGKDSSLRFVYPKSLLQEGS